MGALGLERQLAGVSGSSEAVVLLLACVITAGI